MTQPIVAILGASTNRAKFGNKSVRAHLSKGYRVYPINPKGDLVEGLETFRTLSDVPEPHLTRISVYLPPHLLLPALDDIAKTSHDQLWLNPGTESDEVLKRAAALQLNLIRGCSIVDLGVSPSDFP